MLAYCYITVVLTNPVGLLVSIVTISVKPEISGQIFENAKMSNLKKKILLVGAELFHADGRTDRQTRHS